MTTWSQATKRYMRKSSGGKENKNDWIYVDLDNLRELASGRRQGWVKNGRVLQPDIRLYLTNKQKLKSTPVKLKESQRRLVKEVISAESKKINHKVYALAVCSNHVHIVAEPCSESISRIVQRYKRVSTYTLQKNGFNGKVWTLSLIHI